MSSLRVVVTGAHGQLGFDLISILKNNNQYEVYGFGRQELDITNPKQVKEIIEKIDPDIIIHTAAYTNVDMAEKEQELAFKINVTGTQNIVLAASKQKAKLIYMSTDYVFNGNALYPYSESDSPDPIGVYGKTKLAGEEFVRTHHDKFFIVRTSWIYGEHGHNFVKSMLRLALENKSISVVNDQVGSPTYTEDLSDSLIEIMESEKYGIYHISNSGSCTWYEFACAIFEEANLPVNLKQCKTIDFPRLAHRPKYSVLSNTSIHKNGFSPIRHWREALHVFLQSHSFEDLNIDRKSHV